MKTDDTSSALSRWAALLHRLSGIGLALFLPVHFLALGLALEGATALDGMLVWTEHWSVKVAEWGLVVLLGLHLTLGCRLLVLEMLPWGAIPSLRPGLVYAGVGLSALAGGVFILGVI
ncbi:MAG: succinate dehydrogenase [Pikeienuella sp.]